MLNLQAERGLLGSRGPLGLLPNNRGIEDRKDSSPFHSGEEETLVKYPVRTVIGAVVVLVLAQTYCSFTTPWIVLLFAVWVLVGSKLT